MWSLSRIHLTVTCIKWTAYMCIAVVYKLGIWGRVYYRCFKSKFFLLHTLYIITRLQSISTLWYLIYQVDLIFFRVWNFKKYKVASTLFFQVQEPFSAQKKLEVAFWNNTALIMHSGVKNGKKICTYFAIHYIHLEICA